MRTLHTIRLRGPWGCEPLARFEWSEAGERRETAADLPQAGRLTMPADWSPICGADFQGRVRFRRRFHWPTRLTPRERVWLVFEEIRGRAAIRLNDRALGEIPAGETPMEYDVTGGLEPTNVLLAEVWWPPHDAGAPVSDRLAGGIPGEVRLEVRTL